MIKISCVSYTNSIPFIYGIKNYKFNSPVEFTLDTPAECAYKLLTNQVDIGLVPVAILPKMEKFEIVSDFCIGANNEVRTVLLMSNVPLAKITKVYLDYQSRTSVRLVKILANQFWNKDIEFVNAEQGFEEYKLNGDEGIVLIGDRVFEYENSFQYKIDLAQEWIKYTSLPFVFAAWTANKEINPEFKSEFNQALQSGIDQIPDAINSIETPNEQIDYHEYLTKNINYNLDQSKMNGLELFLTYVKKYNL